MKSAFMAAAAAVIAVTSFASPASAYYGYGGPGGYYEPVNPYADVEIVDQNLYRHATLSSDSDAPVGVQLVLAMDTSGSMSEEEFEIELMATAYALNSELVRSAIKYRNGNKSVAISVIDFDDTARLRVPWVDIRGDQINDKPYRPDDPENSSDAPDVLDALAQEIMELPRRGNGGTTIESATDLAYKLYLGSPWEVDEEGGRRVLDLFGDGTTMSISRLHDSRDKLVSIGVTINGFAILNGSSGLDRYYEQNLVTQSRVRSPDGIYADRGRVWAVARDTPVTKDDKPGMKAYFNDVAIGMTQKISLEIAGAEDFYQILDRLDRDPAIPVPEPVNMDLQERIYGREINYELIQF